jgi:hypothetical protein
MIGVGGATLTDAGALDARLHFVPLLLDHTFGLASNNHDTPIRDALSRKDDSDAWFPLVEMTMYAGAQGPAGVFGLAVNEVPRPTFDVEDKALYAVPIYAGGGVSLVEDGFMFGGSAAIVGAWTATPSDSWP